MFMLISVLIIIVCILLILIVLVQNSKGGGLASNFSSSNQVMGVKKTADFLEKATWTLAGSLLVLSLIASLTIPRGNKEQHSILREAAEEVNPMNIQYNPQQVVAPTPEEDDGAGD